MIKSKKDYTDYLRADAKALKADKQGWLKSLPFPDPVWKFQRPPRRIEYLNNCPTLLNRPAWLLAKKRFRSKQMRLGLSIPVNAYGTGLSIAHFGDPVVNPNARALAGTPAKVVKEKAEPWTVFNKI